MQGTTAQAGAQGGSILSARGRTHRAFEGWPARQAASPPSLPRAAVTSRRSGAAQGVYDPEMRVFSVTIRGTPACFAAPENRTVLESALAAGVEMASSCRTGTCRTCLRRALSGAVRYDISWPGVLPEEKAEGFFLPCVAYPASDLLITGSSPKFWWE